MFKGNKSGNDNEWFVSIVLPKEFFEELAEVLRKIEYPLSYDYTLEDKLLMLVIGCNKKAFSELVLTLINYNSNHEFRIIV